MGYMRKGKHVSKYLDPMGKTAAFLYLLHGFANQNLSTR